MSDEQAKIVSVVRDGDEHLGVVRQGKDGWLVAVPADGGEIASGFSDLDHAERWLRRRFFRTGIDARQERSVTSRNNESGQDGGVRQT